MRLRGEIKTRPDGLRANTPASRDGLHPTCDLLAFRGLANSALGKGARGSTFIEARHEIAAWRLPQLYIPGLRDPNSGRPTGKPLSWFQREGGWPVRNSYSWIYRRAA